MKEYLPLLTFVLCVHILVTQVISTGSKLLGVGFIASVYNEKLNRFDCPGVGNYPVRDNCSQFFHCYFPGHKPTSIYECGGHDTKFHHLTRKCEPAWLVDCKLCKVKGVFPDKTSRNHFIQCGRGQIAERYKCLAGEFQADTMQCSSQHNSSDEMRVGILKDAEPDPPESIVQFMKQWNKVRRLKELKIKTLKDKPKKSRKQRSHPSKNQH